MSWGIVLPNSRSFPQADLQGSNSVSEQTGTRLATYRSVAYPDPSESEIFCHIRPIFSVFPSEFPIRIHFILIRIQSKIVKGTDPDPGFS